MEDQHTGGDVIVQILKAAGIEYVFGIISIHNIPIYDAIARQNGMRTITNRSEPGAVNMADGYAKATGKLGVVFTSTGSGAGNAAGSLMEAQTNGTPLLHLTGQIDSPYLDQSKGFIHESAKVLSQEMPMKRVAQPELSAMGESVLSHYEQRLRVEEDLSVATVRNYLSDLRQFAAWCEASWQQGREHAASFTPEKVATPTLIEYRTYLQHLLQLKPTSVNRALVTLKRYFAWLVASGQLTYDPAKVVKLVGEEVIPPRHLDDQEEQALVAAVTKEGSARDQAILILMLHTGLRAREVCTLTRAHVRLGKRSGTLTVHGKRNKYREVPLNATARAALAAYDPTLPKTHSHDLTPLFLSEKRHARLTERGLGYLVKKYAQLAKLHDVSPHDLRHRFGYRMAASVPLHRLAQLMGHDSLDTTLIYVRGTPSDLQHAVETIAWV